MKDKLAAAYDPEKFREFGHELVDSIANYLQQAQERTIPANNWTPPAEQLEFWQGYEMDPESPMAFFNELMQRSINVQHPHYIGHQISPAAPLSALSSLLGSVMSNGMGVYEMGPAATAIEKVVIDAVIDKVGYPKSADGFLTSGGTLANLTALLSVRKAMVEADIWQEGQQGNLAVMVSSEAHYCVDRALRIMGFGSQGIIQVPVGADFRMQTDLLPTYFEQAKAAGLQVIAVVGSAPSTSTGIYDDFEAIGAFCRANKLWFHVDAAHGGAAIFSPKYKHLLAGMEQADSIVIDGHKMLMTPSIMTFLLFKQKHHSYATFSQKAQYLWEKEQEEEWYNLARRTFECTKLMMSIQFYVLLKFYGEAVFDQFVTHLYDLGDTLAQKINATPQLELAIPPHSNIVCFRFAPADISGSKLNELNMQIRTQLLEKGEFYIVQTTLNEAVYLRVTLMNPHTTEKVLDDLLTEIKAMGSNTVAELNHD